MKKPTIIAASDVPCIFDDACVERLSNISKLSWAANLTRFGVSLRDAVAIYVRDFEVAGSNEVNREITTLYREAARPRPKFDLLADLRRRLSPEAVAYLNDRAARPNVPWKLPDPDVLLQPSTQAQACDDIVRLCWIGGEKKQGRKRPSGKHSMTFVADPHAPPLRAHVPKRNLELTLLINLRLAVIEATGMVPPSTARHVTPTNRLSEVRYPRRRLPPFAEMAKECLKLIGRPDVDVVELIKKLQRRRRWAEAAGPTENPFEEDPDWAPLKILRG
jgi:hypothetical protein